MDTVHVIGAYGRTYNTQEAVKGDWAAGKDFKIMYDGPYISIRDAERENLSVVAYYGKRNEKVLVLR